MRLLCLAVASALLIPVECLIAQQPLPLEVGQRVRVSHSCTTRSFARSTREDCQRDTGALALITADSVVLREDGATQVALPLTSTTRIEVRRGQHRRWGRGALIGGVVGGATGLALSVAWVADDCCWANCGCSGQEAPVIAGATAVGFIGFGIIGAGIGALIKTDLWEEVPLDRVRVSFAPQQDGRIALGLTYRF